MTPRVNTFTFARTTRPQPDLIQTGDLVLVHVLDLRSETSEYVWLEVTDDLGNGTYQAITIHAAELFPSLPARDTVYLRAEHALQIRTPGGQRLVDGATVTLCA